MGAMDPEGSDKKPRGKTERVHLTDTFCRTAAVKPGQRVTVYSDTETRGFCLVVTAAGAKTFAVRYTLGDGDNAGKQVRTKLGHYQGKDGKAVATWRKEAAKAIGDAARGIDRASRRAEVRKGATVAQLCNRYLVEHAPKKRSAEMDRRRIERYILPAWRSRKASSISRGDVRTLLFPIETGDKTEGLTPRPYEAMGVLALVKKIFAFGIDVEVVAQHPCSRMKIDAPKEARHRELTAADDLRAFWEITGDSQLMPANYAAALRFQLLSGARPGEVIGMTWDELDLDASEWLLPVKRAKNKREHLLPLTGTMRAIIDQQAEVANTQASAGKRASPYVFPAPRGGRYTDKCRGSMLDEAVGAFRKKGNKIERFTPHDLRRTASTAMSAAKVPREYRDRVLNHVDNSVDGRHYNKHDYKDEKRDALIALEQWIEARRAPDPNSNVTPFRRKAG